MVSPNWPSEDDPDYTPNFGSGQSILDPPTDADASAEELREGLEDLVDD